MPSIQVEVAGVIIVLARPWQRLVGVAGARGATRGSHAHLQLGLLQSPLSHVLPGKVISERIYHQKHLSIFITVSFIIVVIQSRDKRNNTNQKEEQWKCVHFLFWNLRNRWEGLWFREVFIGTVWYKGYSISIFVVFYKGQAAGATIWTSCSGAGGWIWDSWNICLILEPTVTPETMSKSDGEPNKIVTKYTRL